MLKRNKLKILIFFAIIFLYDFNCINSLFKIDPFSLRYNSGLVLLEDADILFALSGIKSVKGIEFRGLNFLPKYEIIDEIGARVQGDWIVINIDLLKRALEKISIIKTYRITEEEDRLIITVIERKPNYLLALKKGERLVPFELDSELNIISVNRVYDSSNPLIMISNKEIVNRKLSHRLECFLKLLDEISVNNSLLYRELLEIDLTDFPKAIILLNSRESRFITIPNEKNFYRLHYVVGYLDSIRYYPDTMYIFKNSGLIKQR